MAMSERAGQIGRQVVGGILIALFGTSIGFGLSQSTVGAAVGKQEVQIVGLKDSDLAIRSDILDLRRQTDDRMKMVTDLLGKMIEQTRELVSVVRVQNDIINNERKNKQP